MAAETTRVQQHRYSRTLRPALTRRYRLALIIIGVLAVAGYLALEAVVRTGTRSAHILERSTRQRILVERAAVVSQLLVLAERKGRRDTLRAEIKRVVGELEAIHNEVVHPPEGQRDLTETARAAYFDEPLLLERRIHGFLEAVRDLAALPDTALSFDHPDYLIILATAAGGTSGELDSLVSTLVRENDRGANRLRLSALGALFSILAGLAVTGAAVFSPLLRRLERGAVLLEEANESLWRLSASDGLTGIPNRRSFEQRIAEEWRRARRDRISLGLLMVDIDHFKAYNDRYGHLRGDECLTHLAQTMSRSVVRPADFVARYGGEEFVVLLPDTDADGIMLLAQKIHDRVVDLRIPHEASPVAPVVTVSIGAATMIPSDKVDPEVLIGAADRALYRAKRTGRNRVAVEAATESPLPPPARSP